MVVQSICISVHFDLKGIWKYYREKGFHLFYDSRRTNLKWYNLDYCEFQEFFACGQNLLIVRDETKRIVIIG